MSQPEAWLRGPIADIYTLLQPAAHALVQARDDVEQYGRGVDADVLWAKTGEAATAGFHLLHMAGALDRLFTYARGESLSDVHKAAYKAEQVPHPELDGDKLIDIVNDAIDRAMKQLASTDPKTLADGRKVGRAELPTTVIGALFHGAEHTARHAGQFITTMKLAARSV